MSRHMALALTDEERSELERRVRSRKIRAEDARRAQVILMLAAGESFTTITAAVGCYPDYVTRWKRRFEVDRITGLRAKYRGRRPTVRTPALEARVLAKTRQKPPDGSTHWTTRKLGKLMGISHMLVARIWRRAGYQPHRFERYMLSDGSGVRADSRRRDRPLPKSPGARGGRRGRRENSHSGAGPTRSGPAALARPRGTARL
jgi:transposase